MISLLLWEMKILILRTGSAGDVLLITPLLRAIKGQMARVELFVLTSPAGIEFLRQNPYPDRVFPAFRELPERVRKGGFDFIFDLDNTLFSRRITMRLRGEVLRLEGNLLKQWISRILRTDPAPTVHLSDQYLALAEPLAVTPDGVGLDCFIRPENEVPVEWLPEGFAKNYVAFCIGVPYATRRLPVSRMIELCDRINKPVILLGDKADFEIGEEIATFFERRRDSRDLEEGLRELNKKTTVFNACGKFNFQQQASVVRQAGYVFSFDNDFIPIASAFGKTLFTIWGNTALSSGRYPYQTRFTVLENNKLWCRPCSSKGYSRCPLGHFRCMNDLLLDFYLA